MSGTEGYRYPGPNEFEDTPADHLLFSGRDDEINAITQQIVSSRLLVLYGSSGLGKSSLLKAGVYPKLRENNFCPVRVRITDRMNALNLLAQSCEEAGRDAGIDYTPGVGSTPWEFFKTAMFWRGEKLLYPVLVFDQFEEIFTSVRPDWKRNFADEIGPLASGNLPDSVRRRLEQGEKGLTDLPPQVKLIFSLREEFYGSLEELSTDFPALFQDRFRLLPMNRSRAELAIRQPATRKPEGNIRFHTPSFTYADDTIRMMLGFLAGEHGTIEPFQLQLLCQHVERVIVPGKLRNDGQVIKITPEDLGGERVMSDLVRRFYADSLAELPISQARRARELCDSGLLSSDGHRLMLEKNEILHGYRISEDTLKHLVDRRILREEPRLDSLFYEIGHDTIAQSILKTRRWRLPRKYRVPAYVGLALAALFVIVVVILNFRLRSERNAERAASTSAQQAQTKAEGARANAEKLASYLIGEDLMEAIKPIGRIEVLESVQKQIDNYLDLLKSGQTGETSDRTIQIDGLAHINRGDLDYMQGKLAAAGEEYEKARDNFQQLVRRKANNPEWLHNLADAEGKLADVASDQLKLEQARKLYVQALDTIKTALANNPSSIDPKLRDKLLRDEGETDESIGAILSQQDHFASALDNMQQAVGLATKQAQTTQWSYILEDGLVGEGETLDAQGRDGDAEKALVAALKIARDTARMNPFDPEAQRRLGEAQNQLANVNIYRRNSKEVLAQYQSLNNIMQEAVNWEPKNERWQRDFAYSFLLLAAGNSAAKRFDNREKLVQQAIPRFESIRQIDPSNKSLVKDIVDSQQSWGNFLSNDKPEAAALHYQKAFELLTDLMKIDRTNQELIVTSVYVLNAQAETLRNSKKLNEAVDKSNQALQLAQTLGPVDASDSGYWDLMSTLHREMGDILRDKQDNKGAYAAFHISLNEISQAIEIAPSSPRYLNDRFLLRYDHMADPGMDLASADKNYLDGLADVSKAAELDPETAYYHFNRAVALQRVGESFERKEQPDSALVNYANAEDSYKEAIRLEDDLHEVQAYRERLAYLLEQEIAPLHTQKHDARGVEQTYEKAIQVRKDEANADPTTAAHLADLAVVQTNAGDSLSKQGLSNVAFGYYNDAEQSYSKAIAIGLSDRAAADKYRNDLCQLFLIHVAPLRTQQGDKQGAQAAYDQAIQLRKGPVIAEPQNTANRTALAQTYRQIGDGLVAQGQLTDAGDNYKSAIESQNDAIRLQPSAASWDALGDLYYNSLIPLSQKQNDEAASYDYYRQAVRAEEQAAVLDPKNALYPCNAGYAQREIGNTLQAKSNRADAEREYDKSAQFFKKAIALKSDMASCWYGLGLTSESMAQMHEQAGDLTSARRDYDAAVQALAKAVALEPSTTTYSDERASIENKLRQMRP